MHCANEPELLPGSEEGQEVAGSMLRNAKATFQTISRAKSILDLHAQHAIQSGPHSSSQIMSHLHVAILPQQAVNQRRHTDQRVQSIVIKTGHAEMMLCTK